MEGRRLSERSKPQEGGRTKVDEAIVHLLRKGGKGEAFQAKLLR
jgi:hypothetical protein